MSFHAFLSYSRQDSQVMKEIRDLLVLSEFKIWTDEGIESGTASWKRAIETAIVDSECLICLLSPDASQSNWVRAELEFAELHEKPMRLLI